MFNFFTTANSLADWIEKHLPRGLLKPFVVLRRNIGRVFLSYRKGRLAQILFYARCGHFQRPEIISAYLSRRQTHKLQVGGGMHPKSGWLNADIIAGDIYLDATKTFPFPDNSFDYVFAEHFIEHLSRRQGDFFLSECKRIIKPGGKVRLSTPDLAKVVQIYLNTNPAVAADAVIRRHNQVTGKNVTTTAGFVNDMFRHWGHQYVYDFVTLKDALKRAGFVDIHRCLFGVSRDKQLAALERHAEIEWMKNGFTLIIEARS